MASTTPQQDKPVGIKQIADKLDVDDKALRRFIRGMDLGVGRGTRYAWPSMSDPTVKKIMAGWRAAHATEA